MSHIIDSRDNPAVAQLDHPATQPINHARQALRADVLPASLEAAPGLFEWVDLRERRLRPEWMDQPNVDPAALEIAHQSLARYNSISLTDWTLWSHIRRLAREQRPRPIRVLDVACGGGDIAIKLALAAQRSKLDITVDGCDLSTTAVETATRHATQAGVPSRFFTFDVGRDDWPTGYDVICSSLFLHHLPTPLVETVLGRMAQATRHLVLINDLVRTRLGYFVLKLGTLLITRSPIAQYDGPVSVAGAFTASELRNMAGKAGLIGARVKLCWPQRMLLVWRKG